MATILAPFRRSYRYLQRQAHENSVIFYSCVIGVVGPVMVVTIPPLRENFGYRPAEMVPASYPLPQRPRRAVTGFDDE